MIKISIDEILDYCYCPMVYKFKYIDNISDNNIDLDAEYNDAIKKTIYGFLATSQDKDSDFNVIKNIWGRIWIKQKKTIELIYAKPKSWRDTHNTKRKLGISTLRVFYDFVKKYPGYPVIFNKKYNLTLGNITLTGNYEVIREVSGKIQILVIKQSSRSFNLIHAQRDLEVTALVYAFRKTFGANEDEILLFNSEKGKFISVTRDYEDYKMLVNTVNNVYKCIKNKIFYICPNYKCYDCSYKSICVNKVNI